MPRLDAAMTSWSLHTGRIWSVISQEVIQDAVRRLVVEAQPKMVILFGSYARGNAGEHSDLDFLVVLAEVKGRRAEMVRLGNALRPLRIPADVLVVSQEQLEAWGGVANTVLHEALSEGRIMYEAA
jgi:uncharacterized protein